MLHEQDAEQPTRIATPGLEDRFAIVSEVGEPAGSGHHPFMLQSKHKSVTVVGVDLPEPGCWELTAEYKGATLSYVLWVNDD